MPYSEELGREYSVEEARLWREVQFAAKANGGSTRVVSIAQQFGIHPQRVSQIGRTWENDDLAVTSQAGRVVLTLTQFGRTFTFEERFGDIE